MYPVICRIGPLNVYSWGLLVALGFLAGLITAVRYAGKDGINPNVIYDLFIYIVIASITGARLFYVVQFFPQFKRDPISMLYVNQGGLVFLGGLIFAIAVVLTYVRYHKVKLWKLLDVLSPATAIGYAIGRIGCYLNGCCYGIVMFGVQQPTQIYSSMAGLVIFMILAGLYKKKKYDGQIFLTGLTLYSIYRFLIEFIRFSPVHYLSLTPSQLIVVVIFILSAFTLWKKNST